MEEGAWLPAVSVGSKKHLLIIHIIICKINGSKITYCSAVVVAAEHFVASHASPLQLLRHRQLLPGPAWSCAPCRPPRSAAHPNRRTRFQPFLAIPRRHCVQQLFLLRCYWRWCHCLSSVALCYSRPGRHHHYYCHTRIPGVFAYCYCCCGSESV